MKRAGMLNGRIINHSDPHLQKNEETVMDYS